MSDRDRMLAAEATNEQYSAYDLRTAGGESVCRGGADFCVANLKRLEDQFGPLDVVQTRPPVEY
jgi:hypothetical protein